MKRHKFKINRNQEKQKGITLVALVITVVVMLILAGVAIAAVVNGDGLFDKTRQAAEKYENAAQKEADLINKLFSDDYINGGGDGTSGGDTNEDLLSIISDLISRVEKLENKGTGDILAAYPIGSIYLSTDGSNPADLFGGTWEAYGQGRTLIGVGKGEDTRGEQLEFAINETGGEYNHLLTVQEMPAHNHALTAVTGTSSATASYVTDYKSGRDNGTFTIYEYEDNRGIKFAPKTILTTASSSSKTTSSAGSSAAHNNMQPYITCYMWKRIS